ncbi:MAG: nucleotidyltransferase family protein [Candidatus Omnitrophica bacterium]|nr:nucleotidyltransferase family protein [Candidatus Omnitrophota bacterium]
MRPEERAVLLCGAMARGEDIGEIQSPVFDWAYFFSLCQDEGVLSLAYRSLCKGRAAHPIPEHIRDRFEDSYYTLAAYNTIVYEQAAQVMSAFQQSRIPVIALKGLFLADRIYASVVLRPMADIDLLVHTADIEKAGRVLLALGYAAPGRFMNHQKAKQASPINSIMYKPVDTRYPPIHLHWHLINSTWPLEHWVNAMSMDRVWDRAEAVVVNGSEILCLDIHHQILYLCHHCLSHALSKLRLFIDILEALRAYRDRIDWHALRQEAERSDQLLMVYYVLNAVSMFFGYPIPQLDELRPRHMGLPQRIILLCIRKGMRNYLFSYMTYFFTLRPIEKIRFIARTLFPSRYVIAHNFSLPVEKVRMSHYAGRIARNLRGFAGLIAAGILSRCLLHARDGSA